MQIFSPFQTVSRSKKKFLVGPKKYISLAEKKKNGEGKGGKYLEKKIFFWRRRKAEKEKEENTCRRKIFGPWRRRKSEKEENIFLGPLP